MSRRKKVRTLRQLPYARTVPLQALLGAVSSKLEASEQTQALQQAVLPSTDPSLPLEIGSVVAGCYQLRRVIGSGGMGVVYEAHDIELGRTVAVKVGRTAEDAVLLHREARLMGAFGLPGLVTAYSCGDFQGVRYLVMELLRGRTLSAEIRESPDNRLHVEQAVGVMIQLSETLAELHAAHVAHRDLKPSNVMLVPPDRIVLMDFGISDLERFVDDHVQAGSPFYVAPEVATGTVVSGQAHLADLYALGVLAHYMILGTRPFVGDSGRAILEAHVRQPVPDLTALHPELNVELSRLIMELLAKTPTDRPTAEEVATRCHNLGSLAPIVSAKAATLRILVADDEPSIWEVLGYVLEDGGTELVCVGDGQEALEEFRKRPFDVVITDKNMPIMGGVELCAKIHEDSPDTDVVMISAFPSEEARREATLAGACEFLSKPFDIDEIAHLIDQLGAAHRGRG